MENEVIELRAPDAAQAIKGHASCDATNMLE